MSLIAKASFTYDVHKKEFTDPPLLSQKKSYESVTQLQPPATINVGHHKRMAPNLI